MLGQILAQIDETNVNLTRTIILPQHHKT